MNIKSVTLIASLFLLSINGFSQSKKVLRAQIETLKKQSDSLSQIATTQEELINKLSSYQKDLSSQKDTFSYAMGAELYSNNLKQQGLDTAMNVDAFYLGMRNASLGLDNMHPSQKQYIIQTTFEAIEARKEEQRKIEEEKRKAVADSNMVWGQAFLAKNGQQKNVITLDGGLQYKVITPGKKDGLTPTSQDKVQVHYEGRLINGDIFDSSYQRNNPSTFGVTQVIQGWTQILQQMKEGDKWEVYIPSDLAYGARGSRGAIGPNETLIFIVELIKVNP